MDKEQFASLSNYTRATFFGFECGVSTSQLMSISDAECNIVRDPGASRGGAAHSDDRRCEHPGSATDEHYALDDSMHLMRRPIGNSDPVLSAISERAIVCFRWLVPSVALLMLSACAGTTHLTFLDPQGPIAEAQRSHFYWVLGIMAVLVAGPIFVLLPFFVWRYRYGSEASRYSPKWQYVRALEIMSWGGPIVIVIVLAYFVWTDTHKLDPYKPLVSDQAPLQVEVIGYDWKWLFIYPDQGIASIGTLAMPTGRAVALHMTSATVMQSFFIPALGSQIYAMGGMVTQLNLQASKPGASLGENTMYNGDGFHQQKFTARAMNSADFEAWIGKVRATGIPMNAQSLQTIARRSTHDELIAALPGARSMGGDVYFSEVSRALFPAVVMTTMDGKSTLPESAFEHASTALSKTGATGQDTAGQQR